MNEKQDATLKPTIKFEVILNYDYLANLAIKEVEKIHFFKGKELYAKAEMNLHGDPSLGIIVSTDEIVK